MEFDVSHDHPGITADTGSPQDNLGPPMSISTPQDGSVSDSETNLPKTPRPNQNNDISKPPIKAGQQFQCMNCGTSVIQRRHTISFVEVEEVINSWIAPQVIGGNAVCRSCSNLALVKSGQQEFYNPQASSSSGNGRVCADCGCSLFQTSSQMQRTDSQREPSIRCTEIECLMLKQLRNIDHGRAALAAEPNNHSIKDFAVRAQEFFIHQENVNPVINTKRRNDTTPERGSWGAPLEFILACLGYAVGLGNVWRFPYLCYRNGGGAFLFPFFIMLIFIGLPLFFLELYIGQYTGVGPLQAFSSIAPFFTGLGYCTLVVITIIQIYYMIIVAWTLFYTIVSIGGHLDWGLCDNSYNTKFCYSGEYDNACRLNNTGGSNDMTYYLRRCMSIGEICISAGYQPYDSHYCMDGTQQIPWYTNVTRKLAAEEYYKERVLGQGDATWENWGSIQWHIVGTLFISWLIAFFCVIKGVQSAGKVVYFTALFPYMMLTALLIRGVTLEGAGEGILFYLSPKWSTLFEARVWGDAASQIFYSFGVACGSLITLASYNNFDNNCHFDACFVSFANFGTSIYAGFAIFSVLGFQARQMGVTVDDVAEQGPGLAFVAYPEALLQMPVPRLWSILFFLMLFILGLGSQFAGIEAINTAIVDRWPYLRKDYWKVTACTCFTCFILGIPMCFSGGVYLFTLLDWSTASWAILLIGMAECASVSWCYGINRAIKDLASMGMTFNKFLRLYWLVVWTVIVPTGTIAILIFIFSDWKSPEYAGYVFPLFAEILGWAVGLSTLILFPVGVALAAYNGYRGQEMFSPTPAWKAATVKRSINQDFGPPSAVRFYPS